MKFFTLVFLLLIVSTPGNSQKITGNWFGNLQVNGTNLKIVFHITEDKGILNATMDSPDQKAFGLSTDKTTFTNSTLSVDASKFNINYTGKYNSEKNIIEGSFKQGLGSIPMILSRENIILPNIVKAIRPQDPKDFPYKVEEVSIKSKDGVVLSGTLTLPQKIQAKKIVILITGSGPQNRDEEITQFNHKPFLVWSDYLTREGIAVLRYDDRGIAKSTGNFGVSTSADFANDVEGAINFIKTNDLTKNLFIGLVGHSEGGMIAPIVASRNKNVDFIVLLAGPGVPIYKLMIQQSDDQARLSKTPPQVARLNHYTADSIFTFLVNSKNLSEQQIKEGELRIMKNSMSKYPVEMLDNKTPDELIQKQLFTYNTPWFQYFIRFNPNDYLSKLNCPVLAVNGTLDFQVSCKENLAAIKKSLTDAGNKNFEVLPLKDLNHLMQKCNTGGVEEYGEIAETVNPLALKTVTEWIKKLN